MRSERLIRSYGRIIDSLGGRYVTAEDVGTTVDDMVLISRETRWVSGLPQTQGGSGDPSPATARGVMASLRAVGERVWGSPDVAGKRVAVQGIGKVGMDVVRRLTEAGAATVVTDINPDAVAHAAANYGSEVVDTDEIYNVDCDVFSPCALGATLNENTIPRLRCSAIAGSANNQLATDADIERIAERNILYAPDFVVNAGGVINIAAETGGYSIERADAMVDRIYDNLTAVFDTAQQDGVNTDIAATRFAQQRIDEIGRLRIKRRPGEH